MQDIVTSIMDYEDDRLSAQETLELFAELIRTGMAWHLQGHYGRQARGYIESGAISKAGVIDQVRADDLLLDAYLVGEKA